MRRAYYLWISLALLSGCSAEWYRKSAEDEVAEILKHEQKSVLGEERPFEVAQNPLRLEEAGAQGEMEDLKRTPAPEPVRMSITTPRDSESAKSDSAPTAKEGESPLPSPPPPAPAVGQTPPPISPSPVEAPTVPQAPKRPARVLDIHAALRLAFRDNREYQSQKESVYLSALSLTLAQHQFAPRFFGILTGDWSHDSSGSESGSLAPSFGWNMLFANGARLSLKIAQSFFQFFTGDRREVAQTVVSGTLTQPLLRGFGTDIVREPLTQSERDVMYEVRSLERFRSTFAVRVVTEFYQVLETRDRVTNAYLNWQSLVTSRDRVEALSNAQKRPRFEVGQARQDELRAQDDWSAAVERYESALDRFKIVLGIATDQDVALEQSELASLSREPVESLGISVEEAIQSALIARLDLKTERDQVADSERRIRVAEDALRTQLDLNTTVELRSGGVSTQKPLKFNGANLAYGAGFDLNLPIDRKAERNAYVASLITHESRRRDLSLFEDNVRLTVRDAYRRLEREIVSYRIQTDSLALARERVESTSLFLQAGRAQTRDVLEAQSALNNARNALTSALINYAIARLEFLRDTEALRVTEDGEVIRLPLRKET